MRWDACVDLLEYISATVSCHVGLRRQVACDKLPDEAVDHPDG